MIQYVNPEGVTPQPAWLRKTALAGKTGKGVSVSKAIPTTDSPSRRSNGAGLSRVLGRLVGRNDYVHGVNDTGLIPPVKRKLRISLRFIHRDCVQPARQAIGTPPAGAHGTAIDVETGASKG